MTNPPCPRTPLIAPATPPAPKGGRGARAPANERSARCLFVLASGQWEGLVRRRRVTLPAAHVYSVRCFNDRREYAEEEEESDTEYQVQGVPS